VSITDSSLLLSLVEIMSDMYTSDDDAICDAYEALLGGDIDAVEDRLALFIVAEAARTVQPGRQSTAAACRALGDHFVCMAEELRALGKALKKV